MDDRDPRLETAARIRRMRHLARLMDESWSIPGTRYRFGLDSLVGLVPGVGDVLTTLVSVYFIREAYLVGVPRPLLSRMAFNVLVDWLIGTVPIAGDVFDVAWKANKMNIRLLDRWLNEAAPLHHP
jgi:hypothetical protein